tara:strand:- start:358 stop:582 length:225 start_codon:yes stop_codon:yes gene_type:complete
MIDVEAGIEGGGGGGVVLSSLERRTKAKFCLVERKGWNEVTVTDTERMRKTTDLNICRSTLRVSHGNRHQQDII